MPTKTLLTAFISSCLFITAAAQSKLPFAEIGKKTKTLTLTDGKYEESFDDDSIQRIGTALVNINTMKVVKLQLSKEEQRQLDNSANSRFLSTDPITKSYPWLSPYQYAANSVISGTDLDGEEYKYYMIGLVSQNGKTVLVKPTYNRTEDAVTHRIETIGGEVEVKVPRFKETWVANVGFYNYKFDSYDAMQKGVAELTNPETEKQSKECHCLPGVSLSNTVEGEEKVGQFLEGMGNAAAAGVAVGDAAKVFSKAFSSSQIKQVLSSSVRQRGQTNELLRAFDKKLGHAASEGYKSAFEGVQKNEKGLLSLVEDILNNPSQITKGKSSTDVYNSVGQGVRFNNSDNSFMGFIEKQKATR